MGKVWIKWHLTEDEARFIADVLDCPIGNLRHDERRMGLRRRLMDATAKFRRKNRQAAKP